MPAKTFATLSLSALLLTGCAQISAHTLPVPASSLARAAKPDPASWAFESSDLPLDPDWRYGRLPNGMRYMVRHNAMPAGTAMVRLDMNVGSFDETASEQGFAHFVEHMAFNGSTNVPEGQMVPLLERDGLAFGADTNASTSFDRTNYKLDLPRADPKLLGTALMLMRETAGNLTFAPDAVARERGVVLSEMRDRNTWAYRSTQDATRFFYPGSRFSERFPIGLKTTLDAATSQSLYTFYRREYVPKNATLIVVGDFDTDAVIAQIKARFGDWRAAPVELQPDGGPVSPKSKGRTSIYLDPALSERVTIQRNGPWMDEPDSAAQREENLLRSIGYAIVNRRLQSIARRADAPFKGAGFGTGDVFEAARSTRLIVDTVDGGWQKGLESATQSYHNALENGFKPSEVAEQVANIRTQLENAAAASSTRSNAALVGAAEALIDDRKVATTPQSVLDRFRAFAPKITPDAVLAALKREALPLTDPLIRFQGRTAPAGGEKALRQTWRAALHAPLGSDAAQTDVPFAYTDFGTPGTVVSDHVDPRLGIREVRFANGVMLNIRHTDLVRDQIYASFAIDGGDRLETKADPTATDMMSYLDKGGLGKHSLDQLDTITAGHTVGMALGSSGTSFDGRFATTPSDLGLQLELMAALVTDPGYRSEGEVQYHQQVNTFFAQMGATPQSEMQAKLGNILSDNDPRFSLLAPEVYRALTFAKLKADISDRLAHGAVEIGLVGDVDADQAIALVAKTFGALPQREDAFRDNDQPPRTFSADRSERVLRHTGPADQALMRITWPTRDDADPVEAMKLELLESVMRIELTDELREALGKTYSPSASSDLSRDWKGYGSFSISASISVGDVSATKAAIERVVARLGSEPVSADVLLRARAPMLEGFQNALKTNAGWLGLVGRAQSHSDRIDRFQQAAQRLSALTPADVEAMAKRYLMPDQGLEVLVIPKDVPQPTG
ncbi:M16 family metallopeptidase [Novosphingobium sp. 9]|uniref:M16 family metallopeptidase n=1 Tax=Novosphingobium sp. 9 TaxID=2025349 RepID=UPI0021B52842|nr:M16 family metallopeptidase [Novosphingobium sp. 9]